MILNNFWGKKINPATSEDVAALKGAIELMKDSGASLAKQGDILTALNSLLADRQAHPSGIPDVIKSTFTRPADILDYIAGDHVNSSVAAPVAILMTGMGISNGGGGYINSLMVETDAVQFAGQTVRLWFFDLAPASIVGDNVPFVNNFANRLKRAGDGYIDITFEPLLAGSDSVIGIAKGISFPYKCKVDSKDLVFLVQTLGAVAAPKSGGVFNFAFNVVKMS